MIRLFEALVIALLVTMTCATDSFAWDVYYDGITYPNNPSLGSAVWHDDNSNYLGASSCQNGILHLVDNSPVTTARFYREGLNLPAGTYVTMEARVKVVSSSPAPGSTVFSGVGFGFSTAGSGGQYVSLWADKIGVLFPGSNNLTFYSLDMTQFHTIRMALDASDRTFGLWVDGNSVFSGSAPGGNNWGGTQFGADYSGVGALSDSYWDYVAYSTPESSPLASLGGLLFGLLGIAIRRKRMKS